LSGNAAAGDVFEEANRLWKEGRFGEAEAAYRAILEHKPDSAWALFRLGEIRQRAGDADAAAVFFERALSLNPALAKEREAARFWQRFKSAEELLERGDPAAAERILRELLAEDIDCAPVLAKLGRIEGERGRTVEALAFYDHAICANGAYVWGHIGRAEMLDAQGDLDAAARVLSCVLEREPEMSLARDRLSALNQRRRA
jgi:predicted Zn-dependent protease